MRVQQILALSVAVLDACGAGSASPASEEAAEIITHVMTLPIQRGPMADYGATP